MSLSYIVSGALILHAGYSSYEHHQYISGSGVPNDIVLELVIGLVVLNFGLLNSILNKPRLGVSHSQRVEQKYRYLQPIEMSKAMQFVNELGVSEFEDLETRVDFLDVRQKRKEHLEWSQKSESKTK